MCLEFCLLRWKEDRWILDGHFSTEDVWMHWESLGERKAGTDFLVLPRAGAFLLWLHLM